MIASRATDRAHHRGPGAVRDPRCRWRRARSRRPGCEIFPPNNPWNQRVDRAAGGGKDSAALIASIGLDAPVHPDFGSGLYDGEPIGIPFAVVSNRTRRVPVSFEYADQSDGHLYPLAAERPDRGRAALDRRPARDRRQPRHVPTTSSTPPTRSTAASAGTPGSGAIFNLRSNHLRPPAGPPPTPPDCRSSPASRATTRSRTG
jgi:hypothetical protein